jgi:lipopolysaccharide transport system permease protein
VLSYLLSVSFGVTYGCMGCRSYTLSQVPEKYRPLDELNPVIALVEASRAVSYGVGGPTPGMMWGSVWATAAVLVLGLLLFNRNERTFVDVV